MLGYVGIERVMNMSCRQVLLAVVTAICLVTVPPREGLSTAFDPFTPDLRPYLTDMKPGETVHLFHSGTGDGWKSVRIGDIFLLPERGPVSEGRIRGSIRIVSFQGKICLRGEVIEGHVSIHDRLEEKGVYFLVVPESVCLP